MGAGQTPGCSDYPGPARSRLSFSNYGPRVNVQGWGDCVTTTGYGDLQRGGNNDLWYTSTFGGTSSASPIVTGAAAALSSAQERANGTHLTSQQVRSLLISTGTPQNTSGSGALAGHIGPLPDLEGALASFGSAPPLNDAFGSAIQLVGSQVTRTGDSNVGATKQTGEPDHAGNAGGVSVWYRWTPASSGSVTIDTTGSGFDTLLAIYTGSAVGSLTSVAFNDDEDQPHNVLTSRISFQASGGTTYRIAVDGYKPTNGDPTASGSIALHLDQASARPSNDDFVDATVLVGTDITQNGDTNAGATRQTAEGEPDLAGNPGGASIWYSWTPASGGQTTIDTSSSGFDTLLGIYTGSAVGTLTAVAANDDDDYANGVLTSKVSFVAAAGADVFTTRGWISRQWITGTSHWGRGPPCVLDAGRRGSDHHRLRPLIRTCRYVCHGRGCPFHRCEPRRDRRGRCSVHGLLRQRACRACADRRSRRRHHCQQLQRNEPQ